MVVRQTCVDNVDGRNNAVGARDDGIDNAAELMCRRRGPDVETVAGDDINEPPRVRVVRTVESYVEVADDEDSLLA